VTQLQVTLRLATIEDAPLLLQWRNDPVTRAASLSIAVVGWEEHLAWVNRVLVSQDHQLFIAYVEGQAVGTARSDRHSSVHELSWTVAPNWRGQGVAKLMAKQLADQFSGPICARVKLDNLASQNIAIYLGMKLDLQKSDVMYFARPALV